MGSWSEQQVRDRLMDRFIKADPLSLVLHRPQFSTSQAGGKVQSGVDDLDPQEFALYPFKRRLTQEYHYNPQSFGEDRVEFIFYILIFNRGHDIQVDDFFDPQVDVIGGTDRLENGLYTIGFISARLWDRGQAGILFRG